MFVSHSCITRPASITVQWLRRWVPSVQTTRVSSGRCTTSFSRTLTLSDDNITSYAQALSSTWASLASATRERSTRRRFRSSSLLSLNSARGAQAFFINGRFLSGARPFPSFKAANRRGIGEAKKSGIAKKRLLQESYYGERFEEDLIRTKSIARSGPDTLVRAGPFVGVVPKRGRR